MKQSDGVREKLELAEVLMNHVDRLSKMMSSPNPDITQFYRSIEFFRAWIRPYSVRVDPTYLPKEKKLTKLYDSKKAEIEEDDSEEMNELNQWFYRQLLELLSETSYKIGIGLEIEDTESEVI